MTHDEGLARFRPQQFTIAIDTSPISVDEGHGIAADRAIRWRTFGEEREKIRELVIVFFHGPLLPFSLFNFQLNGLLRALPARHTDERQAPIDDGGGHGPDRMAVG